MSDCRGEQYVLVGTGPETGITSASVAEVTGEE